jgi:hypothetical protein
MPAKYDWHVLTVLLQLRLLLLRRLWPLVQAQAMAAQALLHRLQAGSAPRRLQQQKLLRLLLLLLQCGRLVQGRVLAAAASGSGSGKAEVPAVQLKVSAWLGLPSL